MMPRITLILILSFCPFALWGQNNDEWIDYYNQLVDLDDVESNNWEEIYDILSDLSSNKINLNDASYEDIDKLVFLSKEEKSNLYEFVNRYAPIRSVDDLMMEKSMGYNKVRLLKYFTYAGDADNGNKMPKLGQIIKYGKHEVVATAKIPFYDREGDKNGYLGYKYKHWIKYNFKYGRFIQVGFIGSQDAGEPFFGHQNKFGYDYYSFYIMLREIGRLKAIALGRYRVRFGMGLAINNDFSFGKIASLTSSHSTSAIRAHSSRSEYAYLQGAAATINIAKGLDFSPFISLRKIDATLSSDSSITTILKTGYHRTKSEMDRKHNSTQFVSGGNMRYFNNGFHIGATGLFTSFNRVLKPDIRQTYRRFYPSGKSFWNASVDYGYMGHHLEVSGETATGNSGGLATINKVSIWPNNAFTILLLQRFYSYKYYSLFAQSFSDGGTVQNESGIYVGCKWAMSPSLSLSAYSDYAYFAWPKYRISKPSHSFDNLLSMAYQKNALSLMARYRVRFRQQDSDEKSSLASKTEHRARLSAAYDLAQWHFSLQADAAYANLANSFGWMFTPSAGYENNWILANVYIGYFNTDDYNSRVYTYERGPLYSFTFPVFFGHGLHFSLFAKTKINKNATAIIKSSTTKYFGQENISTSHQQINSSIMSDLELQLRLKF